MKNINMSKGKIGKIIISIVLVMILIILSINTFNYKKENINLKEQNKFYEQVLNEFGIGEFIDYPELYYQEGYIDQAKVHICFWAIENEE